VILALRRLDFGERRALGCISKSVERMRMNDSCAYEIPPSISHSSNDELWQLSRPEVNEDVVFF